MNRRPAFTMLELSAAAAITALLLATSLKMLHAFTVYERSAERRAYAQQAIAAAAELAASTPWGKLSADTPPDVGIPRPLERFLPGAKLAVAVAEEAAPAAKRIMLELSWSDPRGREVAPVRLTTWVYPPVTPP